MRHGTAQRGRAPIDTKTLGDTNHALKHTATPSRRTTSQNLYGWRTLALAVESMTQRFTHACVVDREAIARPIRRYSPKMLRCEFRVVERRGRKEGQMHAVSECLRDPNLHRWVRHGSRSDLSDHQRNIEHVRRPVQVLHRLPDLL